jgi:hypothetical protein
MDEKESNQSQKYFHTVDPDELYEYIAGIQKEWKKIQCGPKGEAERFLERGAGFFPNRLLIPRAILQMNDIENIRRELLQGVTQNYSMGIRTIADRKLLGGEKLPWDMEITTKNKVNNFIGHTLLEWKKAATENNYTISQLILMFNPQEIGTRTELPNQFVARVQRDNFLSSEAGFRVLVEIMTDTNQLRSMDRFYNESNNNVIRSQYIYTPTGFLWKTEIQIGIDQFEIPKGQPLSSAPLTNIDPEKRGIAVAALSQMDSVVKNLDFQKRLDFFTDIGFNAIEFQGYTNLKTGETNTFIYGLRGPKDEAIITGVRPIDFESRSHSD